jgi:hypothetical protein
LDSFPSIKLRYCLPYRYPTAAQCRVGTAAVAHMVDMVRMVDMARMGDMGTTARTDTAAGDTDDTAGDTDDTVDDTVAADDTVDDTVECGMAAVDDTPADGMAAVGGMPVGGMPVDDTPVPDGTAADADDMELPLVRLLAGLSCLSKLERLLGSA